MIKKALSIMICTLILLMGVPFKSLAADTISSSNIKGVNSSIYAITITDTEINSNYPEFSRAKFIIRHEIVLDKAYVGYITGTVDYSIYEYRINTLPPTRQVVNHTTYSQNLYVCGNSVVFYEELSIIISEGYAEEDILSSSFTLAGSNVKSIDTYLTINVMESEIYDIFENTEDIITYLYDEDSGSVLTKLIDVHDALVDCYYLLNTIKGQLDDANMYLEMLTKLRQYNFPIESLQAVYGLYDKQYEIVDIFGDYGYYIYPVFHVPSRNSLFTFYKGYNREFNIIMGFSTDAQLSSFQSYIVPIEDCTITVTDAALRGVNKYRFYNIKILCGDGPGGYRDLMLTNTFDVIPIFILDFNKQYNISTDFALQWNLTNRLLEYMETIVNGTSQSNQAADDLIDDKDNLDDNMTDLFGIEDDYGDQLNNQLTNIDFTNPLQNNTSMLSSGNFVIQVFNGLIANNPLSILIIIVCIFFVARRLFG